MYPAPPQFKQRFSGWRRFYQPLVWLSLAFHGFLLAVPLPPARDLPPEPEPEEEASPVDLLNLAAPPDAQPVTTDAPPPAEQAPPPAQATPAQNPSAIAPPDPDAPPVEDPPEEVSPQPEPESEPEPDFTQEQTQFVAGLGDLGVSSYANCGDTGGGWPPMPTFFRANTDLGAFFTPDSVTQGTFLPQPNIRSCQWIDKEPQTLLTENLPEAYPNYEFKELEPYGNEGLFGVHPPNSDQVFVYMSLIRLKGSTILITWNGNPQS